MYNKIIKIGYNVDGEVSGMREEIQRETPLALTYEPFELLRYKEANGHKFTVNLREAVLQQPDASNILRQDIRYLAFSRFAKMPRSFEAFTHMQKSNKMEEKYLRDAAMGVIPRYKSGSPRPELITDFEGESTIKNYQHSAIGRITMDMLRFDEIGKIRQVAEEMGRSASMTLENAVYVYLTTTANYTRNSTTKDNDIGANYGTTTFCADGLRTAMATISTSKDRKSGNYLMYAANTLGIAPLLEVPAKQLLTTMSLSRVHGATTAEAIGTGAVNIMGDGRIDTIVVSPWLGACYQWFVCDRNANGFTMQTVYPFDVLEETPGMTSEAFIGLDSIRYLVDGYFGVGFIDDRAWYFSDSVTDATVS